MLNILLFSFLTVFFHLCTGKIFSKSLNINNNSFYPLSLISLVGLIVLSFISLFLNFFFSLNQLLNTVILIIVLVFLINRNFIKNVLNLKHLQYVFICTFGIFLFLLLNKTYNPDSALYHFPYVNILNDNKIIFGVSNLHQRFGHISIMQYLSAIHNNYIFGLNGIVIPLASMAVYSIFFFLSNTWSKKNLSTSNIFSILIILFICWKMNRYSEYGNDAPAHFAFFIIIQLYLNHMEKSSKIDESNFYLISFFAMFAFLNKTFLIFSLLIPLVCINKNIIKRLISFKFLFLSLLFISWIAKNTITTGCLIYPVVSTCIDLSWTNFNNISNVYDVSTGSEAWAKDWSNQKNTMLPYKEYLKNFYWLSFWMDNHFNKILSIIIPYLFLILIFIFFLIIMKKKKVNENRIYLKPFIIIWIIIFLGFISWFLKAPIFRYGYSYIICLIALSVTIIISLNLKNYQIIKVSKISTFVVFLAILTLTTKQMIRINENLGKEYFNYPWPKYFSYKPNNKKTELEQIYKDGIFIYYRSKDVYCFYSKSPCTSVEVDKKLKYKINSYNYKLFYF